MAFNVVAQLQLQGPTNLSPVVNTIQNSLRNIKATVNVDVSPGAAAAINNLNTQLRSLQATLGTMGSVATAAGSAVRATSTSYTSAAASVSSLGAAASKTIQELKANVAALNEGATAAESFGRAAGLAARRYAAFLVAGGAIIQIVNGIKSATAASFEFEREMVRLTQIGAGTQAEIKGIEQEVTRLATTLGVSSKELIQASVVLGQAGFTANQTKQALEALAQAALSPNFGNMNQTIEGAIAVMQQFRIDTNGLSGALGSMNAVASAFAVESKDLIEAVKRAGGAFRSTGGDLNEFLALFTSVRATTRESAEAIATGLRTIFTRLQRQDTVEALQSLGVQLRYTRTEALALGNVNLENQFVGAFEAVNRLNQALKEVPGSDPRFSQIIEQLGGYRQISRVLPLIQELTTAQKAYNVAQFGQFSLQTSAGQAQEATIVKLEKLKQQFLALFRTVTESQGFKIFLDITIKLTDALGRLAETLTPLIPVIGSLMLLRGAQGLVGFTSGLAQGLTGHAGRPIQRAGGGVVPGVGDTDTIPAMLTPGEYVIRKSAVQAIGVDNLEAMNRYASGGAVRRRRFADGGNVISRERLDEMRSAVINDRPDADNLIRKYTGINPNSPSGVAQLRELKKGILQEKRFTSLSRGVQGNTLVLPFPGDSLGMLTLGFADQAGLKQVTGGTGIREANRAANEAIDRAGITQFKTGVNFHILSKGATERFKRDYEGKIDNALNSLFPKNSGIKINLSNTNDGKAALNTISGYMFEGFIGNAAGRAVAGGTSGFEYPGNLASSPRFANLARHIYPAIQPGELVDLKRTEQVSKKGQDIVKKYINYVTDNGRLFRELGIGRPIRKAAGGGIEGEGSVPALLTPGEYVFSKDAASRIGLNNLNRMNNYAFGGVVMNLGGPGQFGGLFLDRPSKGGASLTSKASFPLSQVSSANADALLKVKRDDIRQQMGLVGFPTIQLQAGGKGGWIIRDTLLNRSYNTTVPVQLQATPDIHLLDPKTSGSFKKAVLPKVSDAAEAGTNDLLSGTGLGSTQAAQRARSAIVQIGERGVLGYMFESALLGLTNTKQGIASRGVGDRFDITSPNFNKLANLFSPTPRANYLDVKAGLIGANKNSLVSKAASLAAKGTIPYSVDLANSDLSGVTAAFRAEKRNFDRIRQRANLPTTRNAGGLIPSLLTPGEYVMGAGAVSRFGTNFFDRLNARRFANGGPTAGRNVVPANDVFDVFADTKLGVAALAALVREVENALKALPPALRSTANAVIQTGNVGGTPVAQFKGLDTRNVAHSLLNPTFTEKEVPERDAHGAVIKDREGKPITRPVPVKQPTTVIAGEIGQAGRLLGIDTKGLQEQIRTAAQNMGVTLDKTTQVFLELQNNGGKLSLKFKGLAEQRDTSSPTALFEQREIEEKRLARRAAKPGRPVDPTIDATVAEVERANAAKRIASAKINPPTEPPTGRFAERPLVGPPVPTGFDAKAVDINQIIRERQEKAVAEATKANKGVLSQGTADEVRNRATAQITKELIEAEKKRIAAEQGYTTALGRLFTSTERKRLAEENATKIIALNGQVVVKDNGSIALHSSAVELAKTRIDAEGIAASADASATQKLAASKLVASGAGGSGVPIVPGAGVGEAPKQSFFNRFGTPLLLGANLLATYGAGLAESIGGRVSEARTPEQEARARNTAGITNSLTSATLGASLLGSIAGPWGAAIGVATGALYGFITGVNDADKELKSIKIDKTLNTVREKLDQFANSIPITATSAQNVIKDLAESKSLITQKAIADSTNFFGKTNLKAAGASIDQQEKERLGNLAPQMAQLLNKSAEEIGKEAGASQVGKGSPTFDGKALLDQFRNGNFGLNRELIGNLANVEKTSPEEIEKRFVKTLSSSSRQEFLRGEEKRVVPENEKIFQAFGRLAAAAEKASEGLNGLQRQATLLEALSEGRVGGVDFTGVGKVAGTAAITSPFGETGAVLGQVSDELTRVTRELPTVLNQVFQGDRLGGKDFGIVTKELLAGRLGGGADVSKIEGPLKNIIDTVGLRLAQLEPDEARKLGGADVSRLSGKLLEDFKPISDEFERLGSKLEKNGNDFIEGLAKYAAMTQKLGQEQDKLSSIQLEKQKNLVSTQTEIQNRPGDVFRLLTLEQSQRPLQSRQERLTGLTGEAANNPALISEALQNVYTALRKAERDAAAEFNKPGAATQRFIELQQQSSNLTQALKNLTEISERNAAIQDRLNKINEERQGRLSLVERVATAGPEEQASINRAIRLTGIASQRGSVADFSASDRKTVFDFLNANQNVRLTGLAGQPVAGDLKTQLVNEFAKRNGIEVSGARRGEEAALQAERTKNIDRAEEAQKSLIDNQKNLQQEFYQNLSRQQDLFFARLSVELTEDRRSRLLIEQGKKGQEINELTGKINAGEFLEKLGITNIASVARGGGARKDLETFGEAISVRNTNRAALQSRLDNVKLDISSILPNVQRLHSKDLQNKLFEFFKGQNLENDEAARAAENVISRGKELSKIRTTGSVLDLHGQKVGQVSQAEFNAIARSAVVTELTNKFRTIDKPAEELKGQIAGRGTLTADQLGKIEATLATKSIGDLTKEIDKLKADDSLPKLREEFTKLTGESGALAKALTDINASIAAGKAKVASIEGRPEPSIARFFGITKASGGPIVPNVTSPGAPAKGTDTVLAMLTPGEFVVRKEQAQANMDLLQAINGGKGNLALANGGLVYLAGGGKVDAAQFAKLQQQFEREKKLAGKGVALFARGQGAAQAPAQPQVAPGGGFIAKAVAAVQDDAGFNNKLTALSADELNLVYEHARRLLLNYYTQQRQTGPQVKNFLAQQGALNLDADAKIGIIKQLPATLRNAVLSQLAASRAETENFANLPGPQLERVYLSRFYPLARRRIKQGEFQINELLKEQQNPNIDPAAIQGLNQRVGGIQNYLAQFANIVTPAQINTMNLNKGQPGRDLVLDSIKTINLQAFSPADFGTPARFLAITRLKQQQAVSEKKDADKQALTARKEQVNAEKAQLAAQNKQADAVRLLSDKNYTQNELNRREREFQQKVSAKFNLQPGEDITQYNWEKELSPNERQILNGLRNTLKQQTLNFNKLSNVPGFNLAAVTQKAQTVIANEELLNMQRKISSLETGKLDANESVEDRARRIVEGRRRLAEEKIARANAGVFGKPLEPLSEEERAIRTENEVAREKAKIQAKIDNRPVPPELGFTPQFSREAILKRENDAFKLSKGTPQEISSGYDAWKTAIRELAEVRKFLPEKQAEYTVNQQQDLANAITKEREIFNGLIKLIQEQGKPDPPYMFASGGVVPGVGNSDTIKALLTPGEFVMNKLAVQRLGANNLNDLQRFANGGPVGSAGNVGGGVSPDVLNAFRGFTTSATTLAPALTGFAAPAATLVTALNGFGNTVNELVNSLGRIPTSITMEGRHEMVVVVNGLEVLGALEPNLQAFVVSKINEELDRYTEEKFPDVGRRI